MPTDVAVPVESSTAVVPNFDPSTYTDAQHTAWIEKGAIPTVKSEAIEPEESDEEVQAVAESAPVEEEEEVVNAAEATPAKKDTQQPEHKGKARGADARKDELNTEIRELAAKRKQAQTEYDDLLAKIEKGKKDAPAESSTAAPKEAKDPKPVAPVAPKWGEKEGESWEDFEARQIDYTDKLVDYKLAVKEHAANEKRRTDSIAAENKRIEDAWNARVETAKSKPGRDNFAEVAFSKDLPITPAMDGFILDSEIGPEILWYLGNHLDEGKAIAAMNPYRAVRTLTLLESKLSEPESPPAEKVVEKPEKVAAAKEPEKKPVVVPQTRANKPPTELRAVQAAPPNEERAAVEADDFSRFESIRNAKDAAKHRKG